MWYIVVFKLPSAETLILSLKFDQFDPFSQMTQKVCQKSAIWTGKTQKFWVNSEILIRVESLLQKLNWCQQFFFREKEPFYVCYYEIHFLGQIFGYSMSFIFGKLLHQRSILAGINCSASSDFCSQITQASLQHQRSCYIEFWKIDPQRHFGTSVTDN